MADSIGGVLLLVGAGFALIAGLGALKFPDAFTRMHAASKASTLGLLGVLAGTAVVLHPAPGLTKLAIVAVFQLITAPVAAHLVGRAGYADEKLRGLVGRVDELSGSPADSSLRPPVDEP